MGAELAFQCPLCKSPESEWDILLWGNHYCMDGQRLDPLKVVQTHKVVEKDNGA